jgi:hypothetical protein
MIPAPTSAVQNLAVVSPSEVYSAFHTGLPAWT